MRPGGLGRMAFGIGEAGGCVSALLGPERQGASLSPQQASVIWWPWSVSESVFAVHVRDT